MAKIKYHEFEKCEVCGEDGMYYERYGKTLCPTHARIEFIKYVIALFAKTSATVLIFGIIIRYFLFMLETL